MLKSKEPLVKYLNPQFYGRAYRLGLRSYGFLYSAIGHLFIT